MNSSETNCIRVPQNITGSATDPMQGGRPKTEEVEIIPETEEEENAND